MQPFSRNVAKLQKVDKRCYEIIRRPKTTHHRLSQSEVCRTSTRSSAVAERSRDCVCRRNHEMYLRGHFKVIQNCTIQKVGYGFLFAFHNNYGRIFSRFNTIHERDGQTDTHPATARQEEPHYAASLGCIARQKHHACFLGSQLERHQCNVDYTAVSVEYRCRYETRRWTSLLSWLKKRRDRIREVPT